MFVLVCFAFDCINTQVYIFLYFVISPDSAFKTHYESLLAAANWGFKVPKAEDRFVELVQDVDGIQNFINYEEFNCKQQLLTGKHWYSVSKLSKNNNCENREYIVMDR